MNSWISCMAYEELEDVVTLLCIYFSFIRTGGLAPFCFPPSLSSALLLHCPLAVDSRHAPAGTDSMSFSSNPLSPTVGMWPRKQDSSSATIHTIQIKTQRRHILNSSGKCPKYYACWFIFKYSFEGFTVTGSTFTEGFKWETFAQDPCGTWILPA